MTTVGYGDFSPLTIGGRAVGMICCIVGVFITSFTTIALNNFLHFTPPENKAYLLLQRLYWKELIQKEAGKAVVTLFKHKLLSRKSDIFVEETNKIDPKVLQSARQFRKHMVNFKEIARKMKNYNDGNTDLQYIIKEVERITFTVEDVTGQLEQEQKATSEILTKLDLISNALEATTPSKVIKNSHRETGTIPKIEIKKI